MSKVAHIFSIYIQFDNLILQTLKRFDGVINFCRRHHNNYSMLLARYTVMLHRWEWHSSKTKPIFLINKDMTTKTSTDVDQKGNIASDANCIVSLDNERREAIYTLRRARSSSLAINKNL